MEHNSEKREIRRSILRERDSLSPEARKKGDTLLTERILGHQWFCRSEYLLCYVSYGSEISTMEILTEALKTGKKVYVPKVLKDKPWKIWPRATKGFRSPRETRSATSILRTEQNRRSC